ncbi:MAG: putative hemolysin [Planctomycetota bacterium]|jgi:putative hemolysin
MENVSVHLSEYELDPLPLQRINRPPLDERSGKYRLRFARNTRDLQGCMRLRYEVFNLELGEGLAESESSGLDRDRFDDVCDHLMVIDEKTEEVIGTYRMQTWEMGQGPMGFYSAGEYDLSGIPSEFIESSVELGRAAVALHNRDKTVLFLLWRGLMAYLRWNHKRHFFGCSSITSQDPEEGLQAYDWLKRSGHIHKEFEALPLSSYRCDSGPRETFAGEYAIPKLFALYIRYGAKLCSPPAIDREFGTIDFLTWTDTKRMGRRQIVMLSRGLPKGPRTK